MKTIPDMRPTFGARLKQWRKRTGMSQLALSCQSGVGQRHISFIESGRSRPGREVVLRLARTLQVPLREQNLWLDAAGFPAVWPETALSEDASKPFRVIIEEMLARQEPYPAYALDRHWNVVMTNRPAQLLTGGGVDTKNLPINVVNMLLNWSSDDVVFLNREAILTAIADEIEKEIPRFPDDAVLLGLYDRLSKAVPPTAIPASAPQPVHMVKMLIDGRPVNTLSTIARFFGAKEICLDELRVELVYPADEESRTFFHELSAHDKNPVTLHRDNERAFTRPRR